MPRSSRPELPATPVYLRIAAALARDIEQGTIPVNSRLPAERALAARFDVNRQTVRAALQHLRDQRLVLTDRRGTYAVDRASHDTPPVPAPRSAARDLPPFPAPSAGGPTSGRLFSASVSPSLAQQLGLAAGRTTLIHHHRVLNAAGKAVEDAVTYFSPTAVAEVPELARYLTRVPVSDPDLSLLYLWLERAGLRTVVREAITLTRHDRRGPAAPGLTMRRRVHDQHARLLALTDLGFTQPWQEITLEYTNPSASTHMLRPLPPLSVGT
ncbi:GntR family transcriptional regulator [Streptomyces chryseus]|uniref:GntR family transcriptional regulator n=2 Tax=Streptomyces chryseus TaxID=68186 RepID=A0ABQ3DJB5_9ACTN|nr:GntR family transcriptional regulator [Streptomyces chryseus]GHA97728.1 GntR family transcriptional regulator [Streptomyces chryseus]